MTSTARSIESLTTARASLDRVLDELLIKGGSQDSDKSRPVDSTAAGRGDYLPRIDAVLKLFMGSVMPKFIEPDAYAEYRRCFSDPATIHASCEDYRAAASIDLVHDEADMDRKISCPV